MAILSGKALIEARRKQGWTQAQLSEATPSRINISTISRLERGKSTRIRDATLGELAGALHASPADLCLQPESERDLMKLRIGEAARNALSLAQRRYRISREQIVEVAPLLFFIAAEQSLKRRAQRLEELRAASAALAEAHALTPHLPKPGLVDEAALAREAASIAELDLFGEKSADHGENPFALFLSDALREVLGPDQPGAQVQWPPGLWPIYEIFAAEAAELVGDDAKAIQAILCGAAPLREQPKGGQAPSAAWARAEFDARYADAGEADR